MSEPPITRLASSANGEPPKRRRNKVAEGFILVLRALLFLLQFVVFAIGYLLYHLGRGLMALSRLRDDPPDDDSPPEPPLSSLNQPPNR